MKGMTNIGGRMIGGTGLAAVLGLREGTGVSSSSSINRIYSLELSSSKNFKYSGSRIFFL